MLNTLCIDRPSKVVRRRLDLKVIFLRSSNLKKTMRRASVQSWRAIWMNGMSAEIVMPEPMWMETTTTAPVNATTTTTPINASTTSIDVTASSSSFSLDKLRDRLRSAQEDRDYLKKEELEEGHLYRVERLEKVTTRHGEGLVGSIKFRGRNRQIFLPQIFKMSGAEVMMYNYFDEKFEIYRKNKLIKIK
ncbi:uncharacterized protein LOC124172321 [Ischnura elegans]|uniref:uncharacterized protein LOC124172321 n=1 Tax=Ischnura elegans TaxID=197161 RepID=UPI001ED87BE0|nr:uncharacterized protein LOC124172321 [Ischnura elegans]